MEDLYLTPALTDMTPASGVLTYGDSVRTGTFDVRSINDIEEEGDEVFIISLMAATGGAKLSVQDSTTTLTGMALCMQSHSYMYHVSICVLFLLVFFCI